MLFKLILVVPYNVETLKGTNTVTSTTSTTMEKNQKIQIDLDWYLHTYSSLKDYHDIVNYDVELRGNYIVELDEDYNVIIGI